MRPKSQAAPMLGPAALAILGLCAALPQPAQAQLTITPTFGSTITKDPNAAEIEASINAALGIYEQDFTNPINVNIDFETMPDGLGGSSTYYNQVSYTDYRDALIATKTGTGDTAFLNFIPSGPNNPVNGSGFVNVTTADMRALGLSTNVLTFDGIISLNTSIINLSRSGPQNHAYYDLQSVASHEIDEVLGIGSSLTSPDNFFNNNAIRGLDLYRYSADGARSFTGSSSATAYFSVDGGKTIVQDQYGDDVFFNQSGGGADYNDWAKSSSPRVQDAFGTQGSAPDLGPAELTALQDLGYNLAVAPEPSAWAGLGLGALGLGVLSLKARRRRA